MLTFIYLLFTVEYSASAPFSHPRHEASGKVREPGVLLEAVGEGKDKGSSANTQAVLAHLTCSPGGGGRGRTLSPPLGHTLMIGAPLTLFVPFADWGMEQCLWGAIPNTHPSDEHNVRIKE